MPVKRIWPEQQCFQPGRPIAVSYTHLKAAEGIWKTVEYFRFLDMPVCFSEAEFGVQSEEVLEELARRLSLDGTRTVGSFKKIGQKDAYEIYANCNH